MAINNAAFLKSLHDTARSQGEKAISSDFSLEIAGFEYNWILTKQCPWAILSPGEGIEIPGPLGTMTGQPQQIKNYMQGPISFSETVAGSIDQMLVNLLASGGKFDAWVYEGTPQKFIRAKRYEQCWIVVDSPDRNWEDRTQVLTISGTLHFHYYNETKGGNSANYQ